MCFVILHLLRYKMKVSPQYSSMFTFCSTSRHLLRLVVAFEEDRLPLYYEVTFHLSS
jgi:hypothetical protein